MYFWNLSTAVSYLITKIMSTVGPRSLHTVAEFLMFDHFSDIWITHKKKNVYPLIISGCVRAFMS